MQDVVYTRRPSINGTHDSSHAPQQQSSDRESGSSSSLLNNPDMLVTLVTGEKIVVLEKPAEVLRESWPFYVPCPSLSLTLDSSSIHSVLGRSTEPSGDEPSGELG